MAVSTLAALATTGTQWAVTAGFQLAMAVKTFAISFALSAVSRALAPKPQIDTATGLSSTVKSPTQPRPILYGRTKTAGTLIYVQTTGDDGKCLHMVQAMAGHEIDAYEEIYIDDKLAWKLGTVQPWFQAKTRFRLYTGNQTTADPDLVAESNEWTDTCILNDTAYIYLRLEHDSEVFNNGIPNVTAVVRGKKVYNPVTDVTEWTQNPALCIADYINDSKYGLSGIEIDSASLASSISVCEQQVDYIDGDSQSSTHERYKLDGYIDTSDKISSNIENMLSCMFGELVYSQGKLHIKSGYYTEPTLDLDESMMVGDITLQTKQSRRAQYNAVKGVFLSKEENYVLADYPSQISDDYALIDGDPIYLDMTLPFTTDNVRAQRLAKLALGKSRQQRVITVPVNLVGLKIKAGDNIRITNEKLGLDNAVYQVVDYELEFSEQLKVNLVCVETGASLYDWALADQQDFSSGSDVELYDGSAQAPTNLNLTAGTNIKSDGTTATYIDAGWTAPADVYFDYFEVTITPSGGSANSFTTKESTHRFINTDDDLLHSISVRSYNTLGRKSEAITAGVTTGIDEEAPAEPTGFNVTGELHQILLSWVNPTDDDFDKVRIKSSTQNDESTSIVIAELKGDSYIDSGYTGVVTKYYWVQSIDRTGNASNYVYAGTGTTTKLVGADFSDGLIDINYLDTNTQTIINSVADYDTDISNINTSITNIGVDITNLDADVNTRALESDFQNVTQRLDDTLDLAGERLLSMSLFASEQAQIMRDAGVTVDPDNGSVTIQAVEALRSDVDSSFNQVNIELDAQEATINLKASTTYVNNAIASAVLDSADLASLNDLEAKVTQAEIDIDGNTASISLKADQTEIDSLDIRVAQAEIDIDGAEASIALKANQTEFTALETRVGDAEIVINALDVPSITQTVSDVSNLNYRVNQAEVQDIKQLLEIYDTRQVLQQDVAFARTQITADVTDIRESVASQKTELLARIDDNQASIISETTARANADTAITEDITQLQADLSSSDGNIAGNATAITALDGRVTINEGEITSQASDITSLQSSVTDLETNTTGNATAITNLDTRVTSNETSIASQATSITQIESDITDLDTDTSTNATAISGLDTRVTQTETDITSQATAITSLESDVGDLQTDTGANATAIGQLDTRVSANETSITSQSTSITNLGSSITDIETDTSNNATAISQLSTTVTQNGVDITAVSQDLTNLTATVGDNTADIIEVSEVASSETRASAKRLEQLVTGQAETQLTEILNREDNQTFLNAEIAVVRSDFNAVTTENRESIAQTRTDLVALIDNNASSITSEQIARANADQSLASDITSLRSDLTVAESDIVANANATSLITTRVTDNEGDISSISADVTTLQADLSLAEGDVIANGLAVTALDTRLTSAEGTIVSHSSDITTLESDVVSLQTDTTGNATAITNLDTRVTATETTTTSNATSITSLESDVGDLQTDTSGNATAITGLDTRVTNAEGSITTNATAITGLTTTVSGHTTSIAENLSSIDGVKAQYSVTVNNNGTISGFGLVSDIIDDNPTSSFSVSADQFSLTNSTEGVLWDSTVDYVVGDIVSYLGRTYEATDSSSNVRPDTNPDEWDDITYIPFSVYTTDTQVTKDGETVTIPRGVYIQDAFIQKLSVGTDIIKGSAVTTDKIENLAITTAKIGDAQITNAKINDLNADKITAGTISTSRLSIDGVTLDTNASGQLVISNEGVDTAQIANNAVIEASDAYTAAGISNLANGTKEVQSLTIQATGAPVQIIATARISVNSGNFSLGTVIIKRDGSTIRTQTYTAATNNSANETVILRDLPTAGEVEYTVEVYSNSSSSTLISSRYLQAMETKK